MSMADRRYHDREWLRSKYVDDRMTSGKIADECGVERCTIVRWLNRLDIETRDVSDYDQQELTAPAREAHREKYGEGGYLAMRWEEHTDEELERVRKAAPLAAAARETNGMRGLTGCDHPTWRGGYHHRGAMMKMLPGESFWHQRKRALDRDGHTCQMCGATADGLDGVMHVHHIVPVLAGGTNDLENLISLCASCHQTAEHHTKSLFPRPLADD